MKTSEKLFLFIVLAGGVLAAAFLWAFLMSGEEADPLTGPGPGMEGKAAMEEREAEPIRADIDDPEADRIAREAVEPDGSVLGMEDEEADGAFAGSGIITGRLVDEFGHPVAGSEITPAKGRRQDVFLFGSYTTGGRANAKGPKTVSNDDGRFTLKKIGEMDSLALHVFHPGYVPIDHDLGFFDGVKKDAGDIRLEVGGAVSGYVASSTGAPLEGVTVRARPRSEGAPRMFYFVITQGNGFKEWETVTDRDGFYRIDGLPQGKVTVTGIRSEYVPASLMNVEVVKGRENPRTDFTLELGMTIAGTVEDEDGEPVKGAKVRADLTNQGLNLGASEKLDPALFIGRETEIETDEKGDFLFEGLRKGEYTLRIDAEGFLRKRVKEVKAGTLGLTCVLSRGGWLAGKVLDAVTSSEIQKFDIEVTQRRGGTSKVRVLKGKEAIEKRPELGEEPGAFYLEGLNDGPYFITVASEGYGDERVKDLSASAGRGTERVVILWPEAAVSGTVFSADGEPVDDATVEIRTPREGDAPRGRQQRLSVQLAGFGYTGGDSSFGQDKWSRRAKTREDGSFVIRGIPEGEFELSASHEDHLDAEPLPIHINRGDDVKDLALHLRAAGSIAGTVFGLDGKPKARARVSAVVSNDRGWPSGPKKRATSDEEGRYAIEGLAPGNYRVQLAEPEESRGLGINFIIGGSHSGKPEPDLVPVEAGKVTPFDVYEVSKCGIEGLVTEAGRPVEGLALNLFKSQNRGFIPFAPLKTAKTDAFGAYGFEELAPGSYKIRLEISGLTLSLEEEVELAAGERERLDFTLPSGRISGRITNDASGEPAAGVRVSLERLDKEKDAGGDSSSGSVHIAIGSGGFYWGLGGGPGPVETDENGCFLFRFVPDGEYALNASGGGYVAGSLSPVAVTGGRETAGQNLKLIKGLTVSGTLIDGATGKELRKHMGISCGRVVKNGEDSEFYTASSSGNGRFNFSNLPPGLYRIEVPADSGYTGALEVRLEKEDAEDVQLVVHRT